MGLMKHRSTLLLLVAGLVVASQSATIYPNSEYGPQIQESVCAQTCNLMNKQIQYQPGQTYVYNVDLMTRIGGQLSPVESQQEEQQQEVKISALADISIYGQCELVMKLRKVHVAGLAASGQALAEQLQSKAIHFAFEDGTVVDVCADQEDDQWVIDVKKSIISALQMSSSDVSQQETLIETDISGRCETTYEPLESNQDVTIIRKSKNLNKCSNRHQSNIALFPQNYGMNQALSSSLSFFARNSTNECTQVVKQQIVESVSCEDRQLLNYLQVPVTSRIELQLVEKKDSLNVEPIEVNSGRPFRKHRLTLSSHSDSTIFGSTIEQHGRRFTLADVQRLIKVICGKVTFSVEYDVPVYFHQLVQALHSLSAPETAQLWEQVHSKEICPSNKLVDLFLDATALSGSEGSVDILLRAYKQQLMSRQRSNYLFGLLAFAKEPSVPAAQRLVAFVEEQTQQHQLVHLPRGVLFGITGFVHNLQIVSQQQHQQNAQVRQVVQTIVHTLLQAIKTIVPQVSTQEHQQQALTLVLSLKNLVLTHEIASEEQVHIGQQLVDILRQTPTGKQYTGEVRVAIVKTLVNAGIDDSIREYLLTHLLQNTQETIEMQVEAYRAVVLSGASQQQLQQIKTWIDTSSSSERSVPTQQQHLVNYIRSHQANLRSTSDPHKQTILPVNAPVFDAPSGGWFGVSRNYELSYVNPAINLGFTAETDVIYDVTSQSRSQYVPVPQTVSFNFTVPIGGQELQLVELRFHQHGLEPLIAKHMRNIDSRSSSFSAEPWKVARETLKYIMAHGSQILEENPSVHVLIQVLVDGKTVVLADEQDFISGDIQEQSFIQEIMHQLHSKVTIDRAFAVTPIDTVVQFPSVNGLPVQVRINSSVVLGFKSDVSVDLRNPENAAVRFAVYPSIASQLETAIEFHAGGEHKVIEYVHSAYSAPQLNLVAEVKRGREITFKVDMPESKYTLARFESQVYTRHAQTGERVRMMKSEEGQYNPHVHICSKATQKVLGVAVCYDFTYSTLHGHGMDFLAEVTVVKTDAGLQSYEMSLESPLKFNQILSRRSLKDESALDELAPFKFLFNTPGSAIDRQIVLEVEMPSHSNSALLKEARLRLQTPWKTIFGQVSVRNEAKERVAKIELTVDEAKVLALEVALEMIRRGPKTEWKPRVILAIDGVLERPVHLAGALTLNRGRKTMLHFMLEDGQAKRQFIKGTFIRERPSEKNGLASRTSADLLLSLQGVHAKGAAIFEFGQRLMKVDLSSDYKLPSWSQAEQAKIALKLQNHSAEKTLKWTSIGQLKFSQFLMYQINYSQNVNYVFGEHFEHDMKLDWQSEAADEPQIRLYQVIKKTGQRGKVDIEAQSIVLYRPQEINYEIKATAGLVGLGMSAHKRYNILVHGQSRGEQENEESKFKGEFAYSQMAKSPLKMKMLASLKSHSIDFIYSDEIEEQSPSKYHGHLLVQMSPREKYDVKYVYTAKNDRAKRVTEHQMDVELKNAQTQLAMRHFGLLRMEAGNIISLRSKLTSDLGDIFDGQMELAPGKKEFTFHHLPKEIRAKGKLDSDSNGRPTSAFWQFSAPALSHESQYEYSPEESWSFDSKTKKNGQNWLEVQTKHNDKLHQRNLRLSSQYFDGECQVELPSDSARMQKAMIRFELPNSWSHESTFSRDASKQSALLDSRTKWQNSNIADLSAKWDPRSESHLRLKSPLSRVELQAEMQEAQKMALKKALLSLQTDKYDHTSKLAFDGPAYDGAIDFESKTNSLKTGKQLANVAYKWADNVHRFEVNAPELSQLKASAEFDQDRRAAKMDMQMKGWYKHSSEARFEPSSRRLSLDSSTTDYEGGEPIVALKSVIAGRPNEKSYISLKSGSARRMEAQVERSKRSASLDIDYDTYRHRTQINGPEEGDYWLKSSTSRAQENIIDLDALLRASSEQSHLKVKAGGPKQWYESSLLLHPSKQFGYISLASNDLKHESTLQMKEDAISGQKSAHLKSKTLYKAKDIADIEARIGGLRSENSIRAQLPKYSLKTIIDVPASIASLDVANRRSGRHVLGSVSLNQEIDADKSFHFDFAWDIERDPASKVQFDIIIKRIAVISRSTGQQLMVEASVQYAENKLVFNSQFVPVSAIVFKQPIRLSLSFVPRVSVRSASESWQLIYTHTMEQKNQFMCKWDFLVGGQLKYGFQINGQLNDERVVFAAKSTAPQKPQLQLNFNLVAGVRAPGQQYFFDASALHGESKRYQAVFDFTKHLETRKVDGKLEIRLPALEVHVASFSLDFTEKRFTLDVVNEKTGKTVDIEASYAKHILHLKVVSNSVAFFPKVDALVRYIPGEELHAKLDLDEERKFELTAKYSGELSTLQFYALTKVDSVYTPSWEVIAEGRKPSEDGSSQRMVAISGKWNMVEVFKGAFTQKDVRQWNAEAFVASLDSGEKMIDASLFATPIEGQEASAYQLKFVPRQNAIVGSFGARIEERRPTSENEYIRSVKVDVFRAGQEEDKIVSTEVAIKHHKWAQVPQMVELSVQHIPSASHGSLRVAIHETVKGAEEETRESLFLTVPETAAIAQKRSEKVRDQMLIGWNQKSLGFALITTQYDSAQATEHHLKVYTPTSAGRIIEHRCAHLWNDEMFFLKQQLKSDQKQQQSPLYQTTIVVQKTQTNAISRMGYGSGYAGKVIIESFKFTRSPKVIEFEVQPYTEERPLDAHLRIDIAQSEKQALTLKTVIEKRASSSSGSYFTYATSASSPLNQTVHFSAKTADQSVLDFELDGHVSHSSIALLWKNLNRKGQRQQGHYLLQFIGEDRFEAVLANPAHRYQVNGIYKRKNVEGKSASSPLVMDIVVAKHVSKVSSWAAKSAHTSVLVSEHKVHIEAVGRCIRADVEKVTEGAEGAATSRQINICADLSRSNILNVAIDSLKGGEKTLELSARIDARSAAQTLALGARWNPAYSRKLLQTLLQIKQGQSTSSDIAQQIAQHELVQEISSKYSAVFASLLANAAEPFVEVCKEVMPIAQEYGITSQQIKQWTSSAWAPIARFVQSSQQYGRENIEQVEAAYDEAVEAVKRVCGKSAGCQAVSKALYEGNDELARLASSSLVSLLKKTHRFVVRSKGRLIEQMPSLANAHNWQMPSFVPSVVSQALKSSAQAVYSWSQQAFFKPSGPFAGIVAHIESIARELVNSSSTKNIRWERIEGAIEDALKLVSSPSAWASSVRVLVWDPTNGQLQMEVKSPQTATSTAIYDNEKESSSPSSWYNESLTRKRRSFIELTHSIINGYSSGGSRGFKPPKLLPDSLDSHLKMDLVWVEQWMAKNESLLRNLKLNGLKSNGSDVHCFLNVHSKKVLAHSQLPTLPLLKITIAHTVLVQVVLTTEKNKRQQQQVMKVQVKDMNMKIKDNFVWSLEKSALKGNDSIAIVGQTVQLKLRRSFDFGQTNSSTAEDNRIEIALSWTPMRKLISLQSHFYLSPSLIGKQNTSELCSSLAQFNFALQSRDTPLNDTTELSFCSPEDGQCKAFTSIHQKEVLENFAAASTNKSSSLRQLSCSQWMQLNNMEASQEEVLNCGHIADGCNLAAYFVDRQELVRLPSQCLACALPKTTTATLSRTITRFGSRRLVNAADLAQVVFVLDGSCHQRKHPQTTARFMHQLNSLSKVIEKEFKAKRVRTKFMIAAPDSEGKYKLTWAHFERRFNYSHLLSKELSSSNASLRFAHDPFVQSTWPSEGTNSFDFLQLFPYPPGRTSRHFVLIDCLLPPPSNGTQFQSSCVENEIDFSTARTMFLHSNSFVHIISGLGISRRPLTSPKMRRVIGLDWRQVIFDNETVSSGHNHSDTSLQSVSSWLRGHILPHRDTCHALALETNGAVYGHRVLKKANRRLFARRLVASTQTSANTSLCFRCDCMLAKDRMSAREECTLCRDRSATLLNPFRRKSPAKTGPELSTFLGSIESLNATTSNSTTDRTNEDTSEWHLGVRQEWTAEDQRLFQEFNGDGVEFSPTPSEETEEEDLDD